MIPGEELFEVIMRKVSQECSVVDVGMPDLHVQGGMSPRAIQDCFSCRLPLHEAVRATCLFIITTMEEGKTEIDTLGRIIITQAEARRNYKEKK